MKIERVEVFGVEVPLVGEYKNAYKSKSIQRSAIVRITATGGAIGLGNIDPSPGYSMETIEASLTMLQTKLAGLVVGMDPTNVHRILHKIESAVEGYHDAKAAIEMACVDLTARVCGVPVYTYLGGAVKDRLLFNAWIGILPPDEAAALALAGQEADPLERPVGGRRGEVGLVLNVVPDAQRDGEELVADALVVLERIKATAPLRPPVTILQSKVEPRPAEWSQAKIRLLEAPHPQRRYKGHRPFMLAGL